MIYQRRNVDRNNENMAVKDSLKRVVDYASYPEKTEYSGLANALHYAENGVKTELCETVHLVAVSIAGRSKRGMTCDRYRSILEKQAEPSHCMRIKVSSRARSRRSNVML